MFSRMSAERFEKERHSPIGPGSYHIPAVFDEQSVGASGMERQQDAGLESSVGSFQVYEDSAPERGAKQQAAVRTPRRRPFSATKVGQENRAPAGQFATAGGSAKGGAWEAIEVEQLRRRLINEEKPRAQAEAPAVDSAVAKKSAARPHAQLQAKDWKLEAQKRASELDAERELHKKVLCDKDNTIATLQKSIQHAKAQIEHRDRRPEALDLAAAQELVKEQARRLEDQGTELQERAREVEAVHKDLDGLEKRFMSYISATENRLSDLTESQDRTHSRVVERDLRAVHRTRELERLLAESQSREAQMVGQLVVRQASLEATVELLAHEQFARREAENRAASLASELETVRKKTRDDVRAAMEEARQQLSVKFAELRGRLFTAEQTQSLGEELRRQLEEALRAKTVEATGLLEAQDDLQRNLEELQSAKLEVEACREVQSAELEALRAEVVQLRQGACAREAFDSSGGVASAVAGATAQCRNGTCGFVEKDRAASRAVAVSVVAHVVDVAVQALGLPRPSPEDEHSSCIKE